MPIKINYEYTKVDTRKKDLVDGVPYRRNLDGPIFIKNGSYTTVLSRKDVNSIEVILFETVADGIFYPVDLEIKVKV